MGEAKSEPPWKNTLRYLFNKIPREIAVELLLDVMESLGKIPALKIEETADYVAVQIQAYRYCTGAIKLDGFDESSRIKIEEAAEEMRRR